MSVTRDNRRLRSLPRQRGRFRRLSPHKPDRSHRPGPHWALHNKAEKLVFPRGSAGFSCFEYYISACFRSFQGNPLLVIQASGYHRFGLGMYLNCSFDRSSGSLRFHGPGEGGKNPAARFLRPERKLRVPLHRPQKSLIRLPDRFHQTILWPRHHFQAIGCIADRGMEWMLPMTGGVSIGTTVSAFWISFIE